ncbi:MAG TPA: hypothetical protein DCO75_07210, partial [Fibrobacteres bacterium]|nr:hypothetical protein [Fibrobacterota bacterium]
ELNWFGYNFEGSYMRRGGRHGSRNIRASSAGMPYSLKPTGYAGGGLGYGESPATPAAMPSFLKKAGGRMDKNQTVSAKSLSDFPEEKDAAEKLQETSDNPVQNLFNVKARTNLNETAFFYPLLQTNDSNGIVIRFKMPEALTKWKMLGFAHTRDLKYGMISKELVTQKTLMVMPHLPRFLREGDRITLTATVANMADNDLVGSGRLMLFDAATAKSADVLFGNKNPEISFTATKGKSALLSWDITAPEGISALTVRMAVKASGFSDAEEDVLPVLSNRMLVTESVPLSIRKKGTKKFILEKLVSKNNGSTTAVNHKLTLEFASDPIWYAIQALPSIMEYSGECSERAFNSFYANSIASYIANSFPRIKSVFDQWRGLSSDALLSNLEKNTELKAIAMEETPWLLDGKGESERKKRLGVLFDLNTMAANRANFLEKLKKLQMSNGGWPWFEGMPDDRFITQYIAIGLGRLLHLGIIDGQSAGIDDMLKSCLKYLDDRIVEDYRTTLTMFSGEMDKNHISELQIQYLYMRSFFRDVGIDNKNKKAFDYYMNQAKKYWIGNSRYLQGMIALALARNNETKIPAQIIASLRENAVASEEMGMYWKEMYEGDYWLWHMAPIESQALMIEAFDEIAHDIASVEELKTWLIKSKQTQNWGSTKATAEACFALLLRGQKGLEHVSNVKIALGDTVIDLSHLKNAGPEAGTGYFKMSWNSTDIKPDMGNVAITKNEPGVAWGALYLQYFEQLDKIKQHDSPLKIIKKMFVKNNSAKGPVISSIDSTTRLKPGDMITVRMELRVDRDMEYVHIKDMRASGLEPTNVFSGYRNQDGLCYYESFKDAAVNFFISYLHKGTYVFEYRLVAAHAGDFSNGITNVQCMYAPEFSSHSEGIRIKIN